MIFKLGDNIEGKTNEYFSQCMYLVDFQKKVKIGDKIHTYRNQTMTNNLIKEYIFKGFSNCNHTGKPADSCKNCKGYAMITKNEGEKIDHICTGYSKGKESCILKIVENNMVEKFKWNEFEI